MYGRFQLKHDRVLEAGRPADDGEPKRVGVEERERETRLSYIAIECGLAVSGTYQTVKLLAYLPWRTNERTNDAETKHTDTKRCFS